MGDPYVKRQRNQFVATTKELKNQVSSVVPNSAHFLSEPKTTKEFMDDQFRTFTLIGDLCDNLHAQSEDWKATYLDLLHRYDPNKCEDPNYLTLQQMGSTFTSIDEELRQ